MKRTGIKRGTKRLKRGYIKRGDSELKRTQLRPVSSKQRTKAKSFASDGPIDFGKLCDLCGIRQATDMDHMQRRSRRPDLIADPANRRDLCRPCHRLVTETPDIEGETYEKVRAAALHWHPTNQGDQ